MNNLPADNTNESFSKLDWEFPTKTLS